MINRRIGFTLVELLVVISVIGILVALLLPAVQYAREAARRTQCKNNLKQIGLALQNYHDVHKRLPPGWSASAPEGPAGWAWSAQILPFMEQRNVYHQIRFDRTIDDAANALARIRPIGTFLCPSSPGESVFVIGEEHAHHHHHTGGHAHDIDAGHPLFPIARSNYVGVFGTLQIEDAPSAGDGTFFHNSSVRFGDIVDGLSNTFLVGERSSKLGGSTWTGVVPGAAEAMARVVGSTDHSPNSAHHHFDDFSSYHATGAHFVLGDGSVRIINDQIELSVYRALATRNGGEPIDATR